MTRVEPHLAVAHGSLFYRCNICGNNCISHFETFSREVPSCSTCGSTLRSRGLIHALSTTLFNKSLALSDFPMSKEIVGQGMSDDDGISSRLTEKFTYVNTFFHKPPFFDITSINSTQINSFDFLISGDVFEHVKRPVSRAFNNARKMLKPGGALVFSVPYTLDSDTIEHFPNIHDFYIRDKNSVLINKTEDGIVEEFHDLVFHGDGYKSLEMRIFSKDGLISELKSSGFTDISFFGDPCFEHGIYWADQWSLPIVAKFGPSGFPVGS